MATLIYKLSTRTPFSLETAMHGQGGAKSEHGGGVSPAEFYG